MKCPSKRGLTLYMYPPTGVLVYMFLYAIWVNRGSTRNREHPWSAVCPQLKGVLSCVRPHLEGYYKRSPTPKHTPTPTLTYTHPPPHTHRQKGKKEMSLPETQ